MGFLIAACSSESAIPVMSEAAQRGEVAFNQQCGLCHSVTAGGPNVAPKLNNLVGGRAGAGSFPYSDALAQSGLVWDEGTLDAFLERPREVIPGNQMAFYGIEDAGVRADLIAYLVHISETSD